MPKKEKKSKQDEKVVCKPDDLLITPDELVFERTCARLAARFCNLHWPPLDTRLNGSLRRARVRDDDRVTAPRCSTQLRSDSTAFDARTARAPRVARRRRR